MYIKRDEILEKLNKITDKEIENGIYPDFEILVYSIMKKRDKLFEKIVKRMHDKNDFMRLLDFSKETQSFTILHLAAIENNIEAVEILLNYERICPNVSTKQGLTPLMIASKKGYYEIVQKLVENGANVNTLSKTRNTALMYATSSNGELNYKISKYLIDKKTIIDIQNKKGNTALMISAMKNIDAYNLLKSKGANTSIKNKVGKTAIDYYNENRSTEKNTN